METIQLSLLEFIQRGILGVFSNELVIFCARYVAWIFLGLLVLYLMKEILISIIQRKYRHLFKIHLEIFATGFIAWIIQGLLKNITGYHRPFLTGVESLYQYGGLDSFPSGHALVFMALAIIIYHHNRIWGSVFIGMTMIMSVARIVVGIHWPLDILCGWIIGVIIAQGVIRITKMIYS